MPAIDRPPFGYRDDPAVPAFDDSRALFVFDGICVLCSTGARTIMRVDRRGRVAFTSVQSPLGAALYRHFGVDPDESYLLIAGGRAFTASRGYLELAAFSAGHGTRCASARWSPRAGATLPMAGWRATATACSGAPSIARC